MNKTNKYGFISGGYIFDLLDRGALEHLNEHHKYTQKELWLTFSGNIWYRRQICDLADVSISHLTTDVADNTIVVKSTIRQKGEEAVVAEFYFKKAHHNYCETKDK